MTSVTVPVGSRPPGAAPGLARRPGPVTGLRNSLTLAWRSVLKIRTNPEDLFGLLLQPIMYLILFTYVFGGAIEHGSVQQYLEYVLPGILVQTVLFATLGTGLMLNQDISAGIFDRFRSLPIARWAPLAGVGPHAEGVNQMGCWASRSGGAPSFQRLPDFDRLDVGSEAQERW